MKIFAVGVMVFAGVMAVGCGDDEPEAGKAACALPGVYCYDYGDHGLTTLADFQRSCGNDFYADKFCTDLPKGACVAYDNCANGFYWDDACGGGVFLEGQDCADLPTGRCGYTDANDLSKCKDGYYEEGCKKLNGVLEIDQLCPTD